MISRKTLASLQRAYVDKYDHDHVALRVVAEGYPGYDGHVGDSLPCSYVWEDGDWTAQELSGTSGISITAHIYPDEWSGYTGDRVLVIGGESATGGEDRGEIIVEDAVILDIIYFAPGNDAGEGETSEGRVKS